jgi:DNA gyrase subunit A
MAIRFSEETVRAIGRAGRGVIGIALEAGDEVVAGEIVRTSTTVLTVNERGYGKRTELEEYRLQGRGGKGIINVRVSEKNGPVVGALQVQEQDQVMMISQEGKVNRVNVREISVIGRATLGVRLQGLETTDRVAAVTSLVTDEGDGEVNTNGGDAEPAGPEA